MVGGIFHASAHGESGLSTQSDAEGGVRPTLRTAFVDAYPAYVAQVLAERGIEMDEVTADAVVEGVAVLDGLLSTLESTPYRDQRVSPLELFREALRPIDRVLGLRGIEPAGTTAGTIAAWDRYELAPGSSQVLGPEAHDAHLVWAVGKAKAMAPLVNRPGAAVLPSEDIEVVEAIEAAGYRVTDRLEDAVVAVVAIDEGGGEEAMAASVEARVSVVVFGEEIDDLRRVGLTAAGAHRVVTRAELIASPTDVLPALA